MSKTHYIPVLFKVDGSNDRNAAALRVLAAIAQDSDLSATLTSIAQDGVSAERLAKAQGITVALMLKMQNLPKAVAAGAVKGLKTTTPAEDVVAAAMDALTECQICGKHGTHYATDDKGAAWWLCDDCHDQA